MSDTRKSELWIGGEHVAPSSGRYFEDLDPDDDSVYSYVAQASPEDMDRRGWPPLQADNPPPE